MSTRAMVLAAGFGTRLRPLTDRLPKPMIPVLNRPLIAWGLDRLQAAGVTEVAINLHHLGDAVRHGLAEGRPWNMSITWSAEPSILGTGGGLVALRSFLQAGTFALVNGDILHGVDLEQALVAHRRSGAAATMVVRAHPGGADFTGLQADAQDRLVRFKHVQRPARGPARDCMFCGIHLLEPVIFDHLPASGFSCVNDQGYTSMLRSGLEVGVHWYHGPWFDLGTPQRYLEASGALLSGRVRLPGFDPPPGAVLVDPSAEVSSSARLGREVVIGPGCRIGAGADLERVVLWPDTRVEVGERLAGLIASAHVRVEG